MIKQTIIYEKKKITIGEFVNTFNINLIWFCILGIDLILNHYTNQFVNKIDLNLCEEKTNCINQSELIFDKLSFSRKLIYIGLFTNLFLMITYKKIKKFIPNINFSNYIIQIYLYILSKSIYKPFIIYLIFYHDEYKFNDKEDDLIIIIIMSCYLIFEIVIFIFFILFLIFLIIIFIDNMCVKIIGFYKSNIKDLTFEYTQSKFIDIEKNC